MKMHRAAIHADWQDVSPDSRSLWQSIAAQTHGWVTPGNIVSFLGLVLTVLGVIFATMHLYIGSLLFIGIGRIADTLDGAIADRTGTKSRLGEALDAGIDKLELLTVVVVAVATQVVPLGIILAILAPNITISAVSLYAKRRRIALHPSRMGKLATAALWAAIWLYLFHKAFAVTAFLYVAAFTLVAALGMVFIALFTYGHQVVRPRVYQAQSTLQR